MKNADFIIIGGGIAGVSVAAELVQQGSVILLEAEEALGWHASGRSAALYEPFYGPPAILELSRASLPGLEQAGVLSPRGMMMLATMGETDGFEAEMAAMQLEEVDIRQAVATCPALNPGMIARAAFTGIPKDIDTDRLLQGYARAARAAGAKIVTRATAGTIERQDGQWHVTTPKGVFKGTVLVNAAGAWADRIAAQAGVDPLGLTPKRRSMARISAPAGYDIGNWPMLYGLGETWYAKPDAGALIVSPCDADPVAPHDAWADDMVLAEGLARYEAVTTHRVERMLANWAGLRTFTPDGTPAYGRDARQPDFIWFAGQGGYGFQSSVAAARFIADVIAGRRVDDALSALLDPARFHRGGA